MDMILDKVKEVFAPVASYVDRENRIPEETLGKLWDIGLFNLMVPREYGGEGISLREFVDVIQGIAGVSAALAHVVLIHSSVVYVLDRFGGDRGSELLREMALKRLLGSVAITEPKGGSDVIRSVELKAEKKDGGWVLNGTKIFNSNGVYAGVYIVLARTGDPSLGSKSLSTFVVRRGDGVEPKAMDLSSLRGAGISVTTFRDVYIPEEDIIGGEGRGVKIAFSMVDFGRLGYSAIALGLAREALRRAVDYAKSRRAFGKRISDFQGVRWMLADIYARVELINTYLGSIVEKIGAGERATTELAIAKLYSTSLAVDATRTAVQVYGGRGLEAGSDLGRMYRDAKALEIGEGTSEIMKVIISRKLLG